jgi:endonuclease/exonuclease/phosphatase family metal-dependent hydrolase
MSFRWCAAGLSVCAAFTTGCGGDDVAATPVGTATAALSLVTFNAAQLAELAQYPAQRLAATERDLPGLGADVVCLQELWDVGTLEGVADALGQTFPYSHRSVQAVNGGGVESGGASASCTQAEATLLSECLIDNCSDVQGSALALCAVQNCAADFTSVSPDCQQCIASNQSSGSLDQLTSICAAGEGVTYTDQTGLLLLSRLPLEAEGYLAFDSALGDRGVLSARVQTEFAGSVDVFCTHLAATLSDIEYTGSFGSWEGERLAQIEQFLAYVDQRASGAAVLLGDMNCGPLTAEARGAGPEAFARFEAAGFEAPYADGDGRCTWCADNPLTGFAGGDDVGAILDHVLVSGFPPVTSEPERIFDERISIRVDGAPIETTRSDHYGVQVTLTAEPSGP